MTIPAHAGKLDTGPARLGEMTLRKKWKEHLVIYNQYVDFYHNELLKNESCSNARDYLKYRSLGKDEVKKFKIGFIDKNPNFFDKLVKLPPQCPTSSGNL